MKVIAMYLPQFRRVRVICVHELVQVFGKEVYLPFIKGSLDPLGIQHAAPVGIRVRGHTAAVPDSLLYDPHYDKGDRTDKKVCRDMLRGTHIRGPDLQVAFHDTELVFYLCKQMVPADYFLCVHCQLRSNDLVIPKALSVFGYFVKIHKCLNF